MRYAGILLVGMLVVVQAVVGQSAVDKGAAPAGPGEGAPAGGPASAPAQGAASIPASAPQDPAKAAAEEYYRKVMDDYMHGRFFSLKDDLKISERHFRFLAPPQRADIAYVRGMVPEFRPAWWENCKSSSNVSFEACIWGTKFVANYQPLEHLGFQRAMYDYRTRRFVVIVSWKPSLVDNPRAADGGLAKMHNMSKGDIGEVVVWHELGHNYITTCLPAAHVIELYTQHYLLFSHLQEFYADMTALHHCSPHARLAALLIRLDALEYCREEEAHTRAAWGIGSMLLSLWLSEPEKWPSIHFPPEAPKDEIERRTIMYAYENIDSGWTLAEDRMLRDWVKNYIMTQGANALRSKGTLFLSNKQQFKLMFAEDRPFQVKREAWITDRLNKLIESGRADKPPPSSPAGKKTTATRPTYRGQRIEIPW